MSKTANEIEYIHACLYETTVFMKNIDFVILLSLNLLFRWSVVGVFCWNHKQNIKILSEYLNCILKPLPKKKLLTRLLQATMMICRYIVCYPCFCWDFWYLIVLYGWISLWNIVFVKCFNIRVIWKLLFVVSNEIKYFVTNPVMS